MRQMKFARSRQNGAMLYKRLGDNDERVKKAHASHLMNYEMGAASTERRFVLPPQLERIFTSPGHDF